MTQLRKYRSSDFCEGEKLPRTPQLSIAITPKQKSELIEYSQKQRKSISRVIREILKKEEIISGKVE